MREKIKLTPQGTQWTAQFAVASELCKLGCEVAFTMGNCTPLADLMVMAPNGAKFLIDVKGQSTRNFWRIKAKVQRDDLYYVLAYVGDAKCNRLFPMSQATLLGLMERYQNSGVKYDERFSGFNWGDALPFENAWQELPL
ncbi:hypothetical protein P6144_04770 [Sphingomonas sp. HITSZ_GF]|uniref:hypothetical protein n=1 Tax=Sphingomonas sp. HITSZ_GF TaxID=3037247 RepID=UPI00240D10D4|nr:hypothetical protein [Sphingomonas sp. HITSZ_GF]MDG2532949.1 hypothetical protein [Sphingomonas sp. HITSZ_GF]